MILRTRAATHNRVCDLTSRIEKPENTEPAAGRNANPASGPRGIRFFVREYQVLPDAFAPHQVKRCFRRVLQRDDFLDAVEDLTGGKDRKVIVYCSDQDCTASSTAAKKIAAAGFENVVHYKGGMKAWREAGLPTG